uniref:HNH endonuclease n=1 Tax=Hymenobacter terricola TaxID=2819236 RepID=UPI001B3142A4
MCRVRPEAAQHPQQPRAAARCLPHCALGREPRRHPPQPKVSEANGLALCPNLHRAFDRHLFWIDADYRVRLANNFGELSGGDYGVRRFEGQELPLPQRPEWRLGR